MITGRDSSSGGSFGIGRVSQSSQFDGHEGRDIPIIMSLCGRTHLDLSPG